jgi:hypothetical protein
MHLLAMFVATATLQVLDLTNARLSGSIPTAWFDSSARAATARGLLPTITATTASTKPSMVVGLAQLAELRLAGNSLSVNISNGIELLKNLRVLDLSGNAVGGPLPLKLATLSKLQVSNPYCHNQSAWEHESLLLATCCIAPQTPHIRHRTFTAIKVLKVKS